MSPRMHCAYFHEFVLTARFERKWRTSVSQNSVSQCRGQAQYSSLSLSRLSLFRFSLLLFVAFASLLFVYVLFFSRSFSLPSVCMCVIFMFHVFFVMVLCPAREPSHACGVGLEVFQVCLQVEDRPGWMMRGCFVKDLSRWMLTGSGLLSFRRSGGGSLNVLATWRAAISARINAPNQPSPSSRCWVTDISVSDILPWCSVLVKQGVTCRGCKGDHCVVVVCCVRLYPSNWKQLQCGQT